MGQNKIAVARGWAIFAVCSLGFLLSQFYRVSVTIISPQLSHDLALSVPELATLSAAFFYAFAACQVLVGFLLDRWGARRCLLYFSVMGLSGAASFALAQNQGWALAGRVLLGLGLASNLMAPMVLLAAWFPPGRFATISGLLVGLGYLGPLIAATPLAWLAQNWGWRWGFLVIGALHALQVGGVFLVVRDHPPDRQPSPRSPGAHGQGLGQLLRRPYFWIISLASFFRYGCLAAIMGLWAGPFLMSGLGLSAIEAGNVLLTLTLAHILCLPLAGRLSDRTLDTRKWIVLAGLLLSAALTLTLGWLPRGGSLLMTHLIFALIGLAAAPGQITYVHIKELAPPSVQGAAMTGVNLFTMLGPAAIMQAVGALVSADPQALNTPQAFLPAWYLMAAGLALSGLAYLWTPDSRRAGTGE
jgi:MFS family permease